MRSYRNLVHATGAGLLISLPDLLIVASSLSALTGDIRTLCACMGLVHCLLALGACALTLDHDNFVGAAALAGTETAKALGMCLICGGTAAFGALVTMTAILIQCLALKASADKTTPPPVRATYLATVWQSPGNPCSHRRLGRDRPGTGS